MELHPATLWEAIADAVADRPAQIHGPRRLTWRQFDDRSARLAAAFAAAGVAPGAKVGQLLYNTPEFMETYFAALKLRAVPFNINYRYTSPEVAYLLENADAEVLVYDASLRDLVAAATADGPALKALIEVGSEPGDVLDGSNRYEDLIASHDPAPRIERSAADVTMIYTGGTTGMPKGVVSKVGLALQNVLESVPPILGHAPLTVDTAVRFAVEHDADRFVVLPAPPLMHNTGLAMGAMPALATGGTLVLLEDRRFDVEQLWDTVARERVSGLIIVGDAFARPMLSALAARADRDLSSLQLIASSGAMFSTEVKTGLLEHLPQAVIVDVIGASEGTMGLSIATASAPVRTGEFFPAPGVIVVTPDGQRVEPGSGIDGLVALPGGAEGYYKDDEKTAATFKVIDGTRYTIPGDWATVEADGTLRLLGRGSQCINTAGEKVFPEEVEETLKALPSVEDALVFGVPDERFGQRVVAVLSRAPGMDQPPEEMVDALRSSLAAYKLPRAVVVVDEVPRTDVGKADYPAARDLFEAHA